ncbi:MAG TPA: hypothetical protein VFE14_19375 [Micromonosporaceae bacterium]|jgi:hypothetical protein|nr:hypothetical protein [Micromonosporaceae bacterium]
MAGRTRTVTGAGIIATVALVLIFGNQAFTEWADRHTSASTGWGWFMRVLSWPRWTIGGPVRDMLRDDLRALLLIAFVAVILGMFGKAVSGGAGGFLLGWSALIFASALAAFLTAFINSNASLLGGFTAAAAGSTYGLFAGWIVGALTGTAKGAGS